MNRLRRHLCAVALSSLCFPAVASETSTLTFAIIAAGNPEQVKRDWEPFLKEMSQRIGVPVQALVSEKHSDLVEAMRLGKAQISMGNKLSLELVETGVCKVFAQVVKKNGERGYHSVLITRADSPLNSLQDLLAQRGQYRFMNGDPKSTSGTLVPAFHVFSKNKTSPQQLFKTVATGNHQKNFDAILKNETDVATNSSEFIEKMQTERPLDARKIKVIWKSPLLPNDPVILRNDLPENIKNKIEKFFIQFGKNNSHQARILDELSGWSGFRSSTNAQLIPIADLELFHLLRTNELDTSRSAEDRKKTYDNLIARFSKLDLKLKLDAAAQ
jgi:phosphonate transport system substrate-binding protein